MMEDKKTGEMSFLEHLEVFRWHLIRSGFAILLFAILAFIFKRVVFDDILLAPKDPEELERMLHWAMNQNSSISIRYPKAPSSSQNGDIKTPIGKQ